jgi:CubicO group peptidase (beta-lactamase class C family)
MTIRHLLTMSAGFDWKEDVPYSNPENTGIQMEASSDWVEYTINPPMQYEPGKVYHYNSGATQLLAHIFRVATGTDIEEYAVRHLFTPLGINEHYWKRTPSGLVDAEGGYYMRPRDVAKLWYLFLKKRSVGREGARLARVGQGFFEAALRSRCGQAGCRRTSKVRSEVVALSVRQRE